MVHPQDKTNAKHGVVAGLVFLAAFLHSGHAQINKACLSRLDILLIFDVSGSINFNNYYNFKMAKNTTKAYLDSFDIGFNRVHVALMQVSDRATILFDFSRPRTRVEIDREIDNMEVPSNLAGTNLADGFETALNRIFNGSRGMRENVPGVLMLLSDGVATLRVKDTIPLASKLKKERGVMIVPIAISGDINWPMLKAVSSAKDQPIVTFDHIYITQNFLQSQRLEICILLDSSGSITFLNYHNWWYAKLFLEYILGSLWTDPSRVKVAVITFNETARMEIRLGEITNIRDLMGAIKSLQHSGGSTNIAAALKMAENDVFRTPMGVKDNLKRLTLLITDGMPTQDVGQEQPAAINLKQMGVEIVSVVVKGKSQVDRTHLRRLASIISSYGNNLKPAVIEVSDYRGLAAKGNVVVDTICSIPPSRKPEDDFNVKCYRSCDGPNGRLWAGNYHYCQFGSIQRDEDCRTYLYCPKDRRNKGVMIVCPFNFEFDDSLKICVWESCSCPGDKRKCFRPQL